MRSGFLDELADSTLDFAIHINYPEDNDFRNTPLGSAHSICEAFPHLRLYLVQITPTDMGVVDELLAQSGKQTKIILETILIQHKRTAFSPAHHWLKNLIVNIPAD